MTRQEIEQAITSHINDFYNPHRLHSALQWKSALDYERNAAQQITYGPELNRDTSISSLPQATSEPRALYEHIYCARRNMENRIKECQMDLF
ncbi:Mobile element protein [Acetobacter tropicalis]|uniref:Mobile element protein n=1 Tax=Acetobacter tropicalis TaxID=104102 RepID=A0A095AXL8_9PROT|nr:Mobile element protein [Acetobacter tropicalis]